MATFREQVEAQAEEWAERHRAVGRHVSCATEQAWVEADACAAAQSLIGSAVLRPYAADPDLKRLRREAKDALIDLTIALYAKAIPTVWPAAGWLASPEHDRRPHANVAGC